MGYKKDAMMEQSFEEQAVQRYKLIYSRKMRERKVFLEELDEYREARIKKMMKLIKKTVGPKWYHELSEPQRSALNKLEYAIYQDILEDRPNRTAIVMRDLGLYPRPSRSDLMSCINVCRNDPKELLAHLFYRTYGFPIEIRCRSYNLNAKLVLSAIYYLGLDDLLQSLRHKFRPDIRPPQPPPKPKPKPDRRPASPYLQKMEAIPYSKPVRKRRRPPPLPSLDDINEPYEDIHTSPEFGPGGPRLVNRKVTSPASPESVSVKGKKLKREGSGGCDEMAGFIHIEPHVPSDIDALRKPIRPVHRKTRSSKTDGKKVYGMGASARPTKRRCKRPVAPSTGLPNIQHTIMGVVELSGRAVFILGNVVSLPVEGEMIHGGLTLVGKDYLPLHCGYKGKIQPPAPAPCDCVSKYDKTIFDYIKKTKCLCGHHYDFHHDNEVFPPEELPFFEKPTRTKPAQFNYETIFNLNSRALHVEKEFRVIYETESLLRREGDPPTAISKPYRKSPPKSVRPPENVASSPEPEDFKKMKASGAGQGAGSGAGQVAVAGSVARADKSSKSRQTRKKSGWKPIQPQMPKRSSSKDSCLGSNPKPMDYLKCAIRLFRDTNIAARLPDLQKVPLLLEWMRKRMYGPLTKKRKAQLLQKSYFAWSLLETMATRGYGHVHPPKEPMFSGSSDWLSKKKLMDAFRTYAEQYLVSLYRSQANFTNILWRTMCQAELPDKKFREIYFSYLFPRLENLHIVEPYNEKAIVERRNVLQNKRYICLPAGVENLNV